MIEENITPDSIGGIGDISLPNGDSLGSGDVPAGRGDAEEEQKKKKKEREEYLKKIKSETMIYTNFKSFVNEKYNNVNEARANAKKLLKSVVKGETNSVEGIKLSQAMAQGFLDWLEHSTYGKKFSDLPFDKLFTASFNWGLDRYVKGAKTKLKDEFKELKAKAKELAESIQEANAKAHDARTDLGYVAFLREMTDLNSRDIQEAYENAIDVLTDKGMKEKEAIGFLNSPHGKYMGEYVTPADDFSHDAFLDKLEEYYNERMLKKYAKDYVKLA